jgi:hypothetical protein
LRHSRIRKTDGQNLGNPLVVLLALAPQQRLIGCILNECMLKNIVRMRDSPVLVEQFGLD